jgi:phenylalanyl-tRNA synthetase beta subunit
LDLETKEDLAEEIGRTYGYENIVSSSLGETSFKPEINKTTYYLNKIREELIEEGYSEVMTYSFASEGEVELMNPLASDKNFLRASILPKLRESYELNKKNKDLLGLKEVKIFEIGKVFKNNQEILALGKMPDNTEENLDEYIASQPEPTELPNLQTSELLNLRYQPISSYPFITRDIALWVPTETKPEDIENIIRDGAGSLLVNLFLFDTFSKEGRVSYAFRLVFQSMDRTLTDREANKIMEKVTLKLQENPNHQIR